eukprot:6561978-Prymnesium_polylepis.1
MHLRDGIVAASAEGVKAGGSGRDEGEPLYHVPQRHRVVQHQRRRQPARQRLRRENDTNRDRQNYRGLSRVSQGGVGGGGGGEGRAVEADERRAVVHPPPRRVRRERRPHALAAAEGADGCLDHDEHRDVEGEEAAVVRAVHQRRAAEPTRERERAHPQDEHRKVQLPKGDERSLPVGARRGRARDAVHVLQLGALE